MQFPEYRARRVRASRALRRVVRETSLALSDLLLPVHIVEGKNQQRLLSGSGGVEALSVDKLGALADEAASLGIAGFVVHVELGGERDPRAGGATRVDGVAVQAIDAIKQQRPELMVVGDLSLAGYTPEAQDGLVRGDGVVPNEDSVEVLGEMALLLCEAGADALAARAMMDGLVGYVRETIDEAEHEHVAIIAASARYASGWGARDASDTDRTYLLDAGDARAALRELTLDASEGADMLMVEPALAYLDVLLRAREEFDLPLLAASTIGEHAAVELLAEHSGRTRDALVLENLISMRRAGADAIVTYHALVAARALS
ncbi:MAG: porphobilinogen synthase [Myxococcales bacterium]|nr:porphobilinogen synthase [Myxococcales bacterium]